MRKSALQEALQEAKTLLADAQEVPRFPKALKERMGAFLTELESKEVAESQPSPVLWRLARVINPKSGREVTLEVRRDGILVKGDAKRLGIPRAQSWDEVRAMSRSEALELIAAGKGEHFDLNPGAKKAAAESKPKPKPRARKPRAKKSAVKVNA